MGADIPATLLFSQLGMAVAAKFNEFSADERSYVLCVIAQAMNESDENIKTLVITGMLGAIGNRIIKDDDLARAIYAQLGDASRKYLLDLDNWHSSE